MKLWVIKTTMFDGIELTTDVCNSEQEAKLALERINQMFKKYASRIEQLIAQLPLTNRVLYGMFRYYKITDKGENK